MLRSGWASNEATRESRAPLLTGGADGDEFDSAVPTDGQDRPGEPRHGRLLRNTVGAGEDGSVGDPIRGRRNVSVLVHVVDREIEHTCGHIGRREASCRNPLARSLTAPCHCGRR